MKKLFALLILFSATFNAAQAQIIGIKIDGDTCTSQSLNLQALGTSSSPYFFGILAIQQVVPTIPLRLLD
jgi:hypothetical protein